MTKKDIARAYIIAFVASMVLGALVAFYLAGGWGAIALTVLVCIIFGALVWSLNTLS